MTKIVLCGANGKMGHTLAGCIAKREDCTVIAGIDSYTKQYDSFPIVETAEQLPEQPDVIIDFSNPSSLDMLLNYAFTHHVALVLATTGYSEAQIAQIHTAAEQIPVFFTFNMSLGINLLVELAKRATAILGDQFDIEIVEKHHNQKIDAPSGTAIMLANAINEVKDNRYHYVYDRHARRMKREKNEIGMHAIRGGTIVGEHDVIFAGNDEVITLSHSAASKTVFAEGAVNAAVFLSGKPAGLYDMKQLIEQAGREDEFIIDSAGILSYHQGELPDSRMRAHAARRGYDLTHRSRPVCTDDFYDFDLIIGMDDRNIDDLKDRAPSVEAWKKIHRMTEYCTKFTHADHVPDPYYGGAEGFEYVLDVLEDACAGLLEMVG